MLQRNGNDSFVIFFDNGSIFEQKITNLAVNSKLLKILVKKTYQSGNNILERYQCVASAEKKFVANEKVTLLKLKV